MTKANDYMVGGDHYTKKAVQPWDVIDTWPHAERVGAYRMNVLKYVMRYTDKNGVEDLRKARHYLEKLIEVEQGVCKPAEATIETYDVVQGYSSNQSKYVKHER